MAHVVTEPCFGCKYTDCVVVCPTDCFHQGEQMLFIDPDPCIDCGACVSECPVEAIYLDDNVSLGNRDWSSTGRNRTVREAIDSGKYALYEVTRADFALKVAPDRVNGPNTNWTHTAGATPQTGSGVSGTPYRPVAQYRPTYPCPDNTNPDDCDDDRRIYLLRLKADANTP